MPLSWSASSQARAVSFFGRPEGRAAWTPSRASRAPPITVPVVAAAGAARAKGASAVKDSRDRREGRENACTAGPYKGILWAPHTEIHDQPTPFTWENPLDSLGMSCLTEF
ncbi:hypothetical protein JCM4814A_63130 [Streptomyces phaeofaciens JCM 4814]|uniref:Uncharacterized protein n=1 Tax=Streptomyces phaeofaciens TaxID=68254 RepID=A0A918HLM9_9ACTN|nr:hypothetical protein GCM10010226_58180 [Streptomyces phaeofaciens]